MSYVNKRNISLDIFRCIAILLVVMVHVSATCVTRSECILSSEFRCGVLFDTISRIGVPFFIMISGALLLNEEKSVSLKNIFERIKTFAILLLIWNIGYSILYQIIFPTLLGNTISISQFVEEIIYGHSHLWYLYMMIGLYIITPFLRSFTKKENKELVGLFILVAFVTQFTIPTLQAMLPNIACLGLVDRFINMFELKFFFGYTTYYLLGWYIINIGFENKLRRCILYILGIVSLGINITYIFKTGDYNTGFSNLSIFTLLYAVAAFTCITRMDFRNLRRRTVRFITKLSNLSFGIYVIHPAILKIISGFFDYGGEPVTYILLRFIITFVTSFVICWVVSKIPYIKKLIHC